MAVDKRDAPVVCVFRLIGCCPSLRPFKALRLIWPETQLYIAHASLRAEVPLGCANQNGLLDMLSPGVTSEALHFCLSAFVSGLLIFKVDIIKTWSSIVSLYFCCSSTCFYAVKE